MRFGPKDKFWVVTDPSPLCVLGDVLFAASLTELYMQFRGGLTLDQNPTLFTDQAEAEVEAKARLRRRDG